MPFKGYPPKRHVVVVIVILISISMMTYNGSIFSYCLFATFISFWVSSWFMSLTHFLIKLFVFLLLSWKSAMYILDRSSLSDVPWQIFSPNLWFLFSGLILLKPSLSVISFLDHASDVVAKKSSPYPRWYRFFFYVIF